MGLEKETGDTKIFMAEDSFGSSGGPAPAGPEKRAENGPCRDPRGLNTHLKLGFEDVIAEPASSHSFDKVWICSHAVFELSKYVLYKLLTLFLAIPLALVAGIVFAVLSCLHIWIVMPFVKTCLMVLPSVETVWKSVTDVLIAPLFQSLGRCFATVNIRLDQE
ncbi:caveolin-2 [Chelonia mydas]|uniref:caveolin-2 n=1 Tax=Chelonia mydas TaxID=8469 RepID=UPI000FFCA719|nr:caveolin-2 [Chelonia mydas]